MHHSMHSGSIARAAAATPMSSVSQPNWSRTARACSFAPLSLPQMNIDGFEGSFGLTIRPAPTLLNTFTNFADGAFFWRRSMKRIVRAGEERDDAVGRRRIGDGVRRVEDDLARERVAAERDRFLGRGALHGETTTFAELRGLAERADLALPPAFFQPSEFRRLARAPHDLVAVLQKAIRERLPDTTRADDADLLHGSSLFAFCAFLSDATSAVAVAFSGALSVTHPAARS